MEDIGGVGDIWVGLPWQVPVSILEVLVLSGRHSTLLRDTDHVVHLCSHPQSLEEEDWHAEGHEEMLSTTLALKAALSPLP